MILGSMFFSLFLVFVVQVSSFFETFPYRLDESTGQIDYDTMAANAKLFRPKVRNRPERQGQLRRTLKRHNSVFPPPARPRAPRKTQ